MRSLNGPHRRREGGRQTNKVRDVPVLSKLVGELRQGIAGEQTLDYAHFGGVSV
jgi:hypothetical protein